MTQALTVNPAASVIESVVIGGDLSKLDPGQRVSYYKTVCESIGLNPLTKPFEYITLNGKLTLYARKDATDQLRKINGVSIEKPDIRFEDDWIIVTVAAHDMTGRTDSDIGVVSKKDMRGDFGNALMKAVTKAKRRVTLSICGLGMLDETEIETIPDARPARVIVETGEIEQPAPTKLAPQGDIVLPTGRVFISADQRDITDAEFDTLPSASAERKQNGGNGKQAPAAPKHDPNRPWDDDRKAEAVRWAMKQYPGVFNAPKHAMNSLDNLLEECASKGMDAAAIAQAWKDKVHGKYLEAQAAQQAQQAAEDKPQF